MGRHAYVDHRADSVPAHVTTPRRAGPARPGAPIDPAHAMALQGLGGNRAVARLVSTGGSAGTPVVQRCGPQGCGPEGCSGEGHDEAHDKAPVQREEAGATPQARPPHEHNAQAESLTAGDPRLEDPGFLICTAFCYLGVPPSAVKDIIQSLLECISTEMRAADQASYQKRFAQARDDLAAYSKVRMASTAMRFLLHGELIPMVNMTARTRPVRERIIARLMAAGLTHGGLLAAEAVLRKVVLVADLAIAGGCVAYCGVTEMAQRLTELTEAAAGGLAEGVHALEATGRGVGEAIGAAVGSAVATVYGSLDPANWRLSPALPDATRADVSVLGAVLWSQLRPASPWAHRTPEQTELDAFLTNSTRSLSSYRVPPDLLAAIAAACRRAIVDAGGTADVTAAHLLAMSPYGLLSFLRDNGLLEFGQDPQTYAKTQVAGAPATAGR